MSQLPARIEVLLFLPVALLATLAMWTYYGSTGNLSVWDSLHYMNMYEHHFSSLILENLKWMATSLEFYNWHPLTWFSWSIDYQIYGWLNPWGFHFSNNILHAINGVLVFAVTLTIFGLVNPVSGKFNIKTDWQSLIAAFLASTLFVVHPQYVESVAWVAERKDLLVQFFILLSFLVYVGYVTCERVVKTRWYIATLVCFFLAVISKPMCVTFPLVLLLADVYPLRRSVFVEPVLDSNQQMRPTLEVDSNCIQYNIGWSFVHLEMYQESLELFERIDPDSNIGPDAITWLNALSEGRAIPDKSILNDKLPGICENLIPAINIVKSVR